MANTEKISDDEIYRTNSVWLGPPKLTLGNGVRYVTLAIFAVLVLVVMKVEREMGIGFGVFSTAWAVLISVVVARFLASKIDYERPLGAMAKLVCREIATPRGDVHYSGGLLRRRRTVRVGHTQRPGTRVRTQDPAVQSVKESVRV